MYYFGFGLMLMGLFMIGRGLSKLIINLFNYFYCRGF